VLLHTLKERAAIDILKTGHEKMTIHDVIRELVYLEYEEEMWPRVADFNKANNVLV
jgi:hypothetical protein